MGADVPDNITPSEYLMMEVLVARHRLGELLWSFPKRQLSTARKLEQRGFVLWSHAIAQDSIRVSLCAAGLEAWGIAPPTPSPRAKPSDSPGRPFYDLQTTGLLWLINRTVLHPRGYAWALHIDTETGEVTGWSIMGDGTEPWAYAESMQEFEKQRLAALKELLP